MSTIIDKIRRLLALGTSTSEHEARAAMAKAAELARRHSIDLASVKSESERARVIEQVYGSASDAFGEVEKAAMDLCIALFSVTGITGGVGPRYVGAEHNVASAIFATAFIVEQCGRDLGVFRRERWKATRKRLTVGSTRQFCGGWVAGVLRTYQAELAASADKERWALVVVEQKKAISDYMEMAHPGIKTEKPRAVKRDVAATMAGYAAGKQVRLNKPIEGPILRKRLAEGGEEVRI